MKLFDITDSGLELANEAMVNEGNWSLVNSGFHRDLTNVIDNIIKTVQKRSFYRDTKAKNLITDTIKKYTGISVIIDSEYRFFAMLPPDLNKNHVLTDFDLRQFYDNSEVKKRQGEMRASVDLKNFKVGGHFKDVPVVLYLDPELMWSGIMTPSEISAVILHEVGHMFSYFALVAHTYSINLPMLGTINKISGVKDTEQMEIVLKEWNGYDTTLTKVDVKELAGKRKEIIVTAIVSNQVQDAKSLLKQREYEEVNTEHLADKFAVRCGAGGDLASGLDKLMALYGSRQRSLANTIKNEIFLAVMLGIFTLFTVGLAATIIFPLFVGIPMIIAVLTVSSNAGDGTYDTEINRFGRMRDDLISMLKDQNIDKAIGKRIRDDIAKVDEVIKNYKPYKSIIGLFADIVLPSKRRLMSQTEFYRELEKLSSNRLFIGAYDLKNI